MTTPPLKPRSPATSIWSYQENFDFAASDVGAFYMPLEKHRGEYSRSRMLTAFHLNGKGDLRPGTTPKTCEQVLFGGHIGCGKSTELQQYAALFRRSYTVHHLALTEKVDINNLRFSDLLIVLAQALIDTFTDAALSIKPNPVFTEPVLNWFDTRIVKQERFKDLELELKTEAKAEGGIPWLASLLASISSKFKGGVSYREELRREIRDGFSQLLHHFNALVAHANELLNKQDRGPLLFIVDGSDKLSKEDADIFFSADLNQLGQISTNFVICAPITVLLEAGIVTQRFHKVQLPMVKIFDADGTPRKDEEDALMALVEKRLPLDFFDSEDTLRHLVRHSGGHPRDLLRLVKACFPWLDDEDEDAPPPRITLAVANKAIHNVATEYQRLILKDDWADLVRIDQAQGDDKDRTPERQRLLYDLVLLEYNSYWWCSHPLVRTLNGYRKASATLPALSTPPTP